MSSDSDSTPEPPSPITATMSDKENAGKKSNKSNKKGAKKTSKRGTTGKSAQSGKGCIKAAAKRTKQKDKMLAVPNANKVTKPAGGAKKPYEKKIYQKVARATRSSTKLTEQLAADSKPYLSCKSPRPFLPPLPLLLLCNSLTW